MTARYMRRPAHIAAALRFVMQRVISIYAAQFFRAAPSALHRSERMPEMENSPGFVAEPGLPLQSIGVLPAAECLCATESEMSIFAAVRMNLRLSSKANARRGGTVTFDRKF
jgi:hypothetical protein